MSVWPVMMACVAVCGCGRLGFDQFSGADDAPGDALGDATDDGTSMNDGSVMMIAFPASRDTFINEVQGADLNFGAADVANYSQRQVGTAWSSSGAGPPSSTGAVAGMFPGAASGATTTTIPAALVQGWVSNPASNHGLLFTSSSNSTIRFVSLEGAAAQEPRLVVMYR